MPVNILIVRIGRLGDMVMVLPAIQEIKRRYPEAQLHFITSPDGLRFLKTAMEQAPASIQRYRNHIFWRYIDRLAIKKFIKNNQFEYIFCFETKPRTISWLPAGASILQPTEQLTHYTNRCLKLIDCPPVNNHPFLNPNPAKRQQLKQQLQGLQINEKTLLIGLHPTYSGFAQWGTAKESIHRLWPWQNFVLLAEKLADYGKQKGLDLKVVMNLLPEERELGLKIKQACQQNIILLPAKLDFKLYLCFLARLNVLITPNTGVMHLAAALHTKMVTLFSKHHPQDCGPYMAEEKYVTLRAEETKQAHKGLAAISVEAVFNSTLQLLAQ